MNKNQLIHLIQQELGTDVTKKQASDALNATLSAIAKTVVREKVQLVGFGTFETKKRPARAGRNPRTGETITIPACSVVSFKPSPALKSGK